MKGLFLIALCLSSQAIFIGSDWWLSTWYALSRNSSTSNKLLTIANTFSFFRLYTCMYHWKRIVHKLSHRRTIFNQCKAHKGTKYM